MIYSYSVIRYVPNPISGEYVNIGVIAGNEESSDWCLRQVTDATRARRFGPRESLDAAFAQMNAIGSAIDALDFLPDSEPSGQPTSPSMDWLNGLVQRYRNIIQFSTPAPVEAGSAAEAVDLLFGHFVSTRSREPSGIVTKARAFHTLRRAYLRAGFGEGMIRQRSVLQCRAVHTLMDFAVGNGNIAQLAHSWSFQVAGLEDVSRDVKAWGYAIDALRGSGGEIIYEGKSRKIDSNIEVKVLCIEPRTADQAAAYSEAVQVFSDVNAHVVSPAEVNEIAAIVAKQVIPDGTAML